MKNEKLRAFLKQALTLTLISIIFTCIGFIIAYLISTSVTATFQDLTTYVGFVVLMVGILLSMKGNPFSGSFRGMGQNNVNAVTYEELEYTRAEQEIAGFHKNFRKRATVEFGFYRSALMISGILLLLGSYVLVL